MGKEDICSHSHCCCLSENEKGNIDEFSSCMKLSLDCADFKEWFSGRHALKHARDKNQ